MSLSLLQMVVSETFVRRLQESVYTQLLDVPCHMFAKTVDNLWPEVSQTALAGTSLTFFET